MMEASCKKCDYFQYESKQVTTYGYGKCKRYAPSPGLNQDMVWPRVLDSDWCGEFKQAEKEAKQLTAEELAAQVHIEHAAPVPKMNELREKQKEEKEKKAASPPVAEGAKTKDTQKW